MIKNEKKNDRTLRNNSADIVNSNYYRRMIVDNKITINLNLDFLKINYKIFE
jgi:hypothetical protein